LFLIGDDAIRRFVRLSVCLSVTSRYLVKMLIGSHGSYLRVAQRLYRLSYPKSLGGALTRLRLRGTPNGTETLGEPLTRLRLRWVKTAKGRRFFFYK